MKRGGGRRYYRPEDMELLRGIRQLLHRDGYTIKGVQKILREQGVDAVKLKSKEDDSAAETTGAIEHEDVSASEPTPRGATAGRPKGRAGARSPAGSRDAVIRSAIAELVACRELLTAGSRASVGTVSRRAAKQRRSA
jgi:DNA-binding transcriptional MerR regulator